MLIDRLGELLIGAVDTHHVLFGQGQRQWEEMNRPYAVIQWQGLEIGDGRVVCRVEIVDLQPDIDFQFILVLLFQPADFLKVFLPNGKGACEEKP